MKETKSTKHLTLYWVLLFVIAIVLGIIELGNLHQLCYLDTTIIWTQYIAPFSQEISANFINLYVSQISTTFLVTAFLSFLGGSDTPIYWTTAMDHKLVHPKGSSIRDFTSYSFCTLIISLVALVCKASLSFLFSFLLNIWFLAAITWRMIVTFYDRDSVKKELIEEFMKMEPKVQQEHLRTIEENMIKAAHNHEIDYLKESVNFIDKYVIDITPNEFKKELYQQMIRFIRIIPYQFTELRLDIFKSICDRIVPNDLLVEEDQTDKVQFEKQLNTFKEHLASTLQKQEIHEYSNYDTLELRELVIHLLEENIEHQTLSKNTSLRALNILIALQLFDIEKYFFDEIVFFYTNQFDGNITIDLSRFFSEYIYLLEKAYKNYKATNSYAQTIVNLCELLNHGLSTLEQMYPAHHKDIQKIYFYSKDAETIFTSLCNNDVLFVDDYNIYQGLTDACAYTQTLDQAKKDIFKSLLNNSNKLEENEKRYIIDTFLTKTKAE